MTLSSANHCPTQKIVWAHLFPGGGGGWWKEYFKDSAHELRAVELPVHDNRSWHRSKRPNTSIAQWRQHWLHCSTAFDSPIDGLLTHFPQLAVLGGARQFRDRNLMLVAHNFNLGRIYSGVRRFLSRRLLARVDRFIVHSTGEIPLYSDWLCLPSSKFVFVPLQRARLPLQPCEVPECPYILAAGTAHRDYGTLVEAVRGTGVRTVIVAGRSAMDGLADLPDNVEVRSGLTMGECATLISHARIHVVPLHDTPTAAGQVAVVSGMRLGTPTIATRSIGTLDYIENMKSGLFVDPKDSLGLRAAILDLWDSGDARHSISSASMDFAEANLSDQAAASNLINVLNMVVIERGRKIF